MKLCWLVPDDLGGGMVSVALSCCRQAARAGHDVTLLLLVAPSGWIEDPSVKVESLGLSINHQETPRRLLRWLEVNQPDVLVLNGCKEADAAIPFLPSTVKCVYVVHDTAGIYWNAAIEYEKDIDRIVAVSETVAVKFRERLLEPDKLSVIHNGCYFPAAPPDDVKRSDSLIFLGGDNPTKGAHDVLSLWKELVALSSIEKLHWFGAINESLAGQIDKLPHAERIVLHGRAPRSRVFDVAAQTKVLLMLSRVEPFGMATIEAMSMGCVPVAWDIATGTKEIVQAERTGFFAALGDIKTLAAQVRMACAQHEEIVGAVIAHARTNFDESVMWRNYETLLEQVIAQPTRERSRVDEDVPLYQPPVRRFQLLPPRVRATIKDFIARSPRLNYWLRDLRGL